MQTTKQRAIAIVGVIALIGLGTGFTAAADAPAQPGVPEKVEAPQPRPAVVKRVYRYAPAPVVYAAPRVVYLTPRVYTRRYVAAYGVYPRAYVGVYPRRYVAAYGFRTYPRYLGVRTYGPRVAGVHYRRWR